MSIWEEAKRGQLTQGSILDYIGEDEKLVDSEDGSGMTLLGYAVQKGKSSIVKFLLGELKANPDVKVGKTPKTTIMYLAVTTTRSQPRIIQLLLDKKPTTFDQTRETSQKETPLMAAVTGKNLEAVKLLVNAGASLEAKDANGKTAQDLADQLSDESTKKKIKDALTPTLRKNEGGLQAYLKWAMGALDRSTHRWDTEADDEVQEPESAADFENNLGQAVNSADLGNYFPPGSTYIKEVAKKAAAFKNDPNNVLNSPSQIQDLVNLTLYQPVLYCDDSGSMGTDNRWSKQIEIVKVMADVANTFVPFGKGVHLRFINTDTPNANNLDGNGVAQRCNFTPNPSHCTPIGTKLRERILEPFIYSVIRDGKRLERPYLIMIITDGCPWQEPTQELRKSIMGCRKFLEERGYRKDTVRFCINQIGTDEDAVEFMDDLVMATEIMDVLYRTTELLDEKYNDYRYDKGGTSEATWRGLADGNGRRSRSQSRRLSINELQCRDAAEPHENACSSKEHHPIRGLLEKHSVISASQDSFLTSFTMSTNYAAFLNDYKKKPFVVDEADDRYPDETEIVIKNAAIAINQIDWKTQETPWKQFKYPLILGVDVAGEVVDVGEEVTRFKIGDRVLGHALSFATEDDRHAGFQNYTVLMSNMASPIPPHVTFEIAAVLPLGVSTASAALFQKDCLALPPPMLNPPKIPKTVLIWGGASSVGSNAIQLAVAAGCDVVVTASPKNRDAMKKLGAVQVVDYNSDSVIDDLKKAFQGRELAGAFDTIGTQKTFEATAKAVSQMHGKKIVVSTNDEEEWEVPAGVEKKPIQAVDIREDKREDKRKDKGEDKSIGKMVYEDFLPQALREGKYHIAPEVFEGGKGLASIQAALETSKSTLARECAEKPSEVESLWQWWRLPGYLNGLISALSSHIHLPTSSCLVDAFTVTKMKLFKARQTKASADAAPDHDFHNAWGCTYYDRSTAKDDETSELRREYAFDPVAVGRRYYVLLSEYTKLFSTFFGGYYPISLHAHASDALQPTTIASLILNTAATSPLILNSPTLAPKPNENPEATGKRVHEFALKFLGWDEIHVRAPNFVVVNGCYGAGYGPLAHASKEWEMNAIASGPKPVVVDIRLASRESLDAKLAEAKAQGCIALVLDLVSTEDGSVVLPEHFGMVKASCARHGLFLIVDETLTAIRCGAPFAFQRSEYALEEEDKKPDLVIFGKGMGVSGIAVGFEGAMTKGLAYTKVEDIEQTIRYWRALVSRPIAIPTLIETLGILRTAQAENWPARSVQIGDVVRGILRELEPSTKEPGAIQGLGAVIAVNREISMRFCIMSAIRRRSPTVRWMPKLNAAYMNRQVLMQNVFGPESKKQRQLLSAEADRSGAIPLWCFICGIEATSKDWCRKCFLACCNNDVCVEAFQRHEHVQ
ncbi:hypothetical protein G7Y89_g11917 [Cudoniella acicularis]|uniref:Enoyl reductase (ER) domain-containing protein n=1 Tax=Cudoniella acicularis TaxID=354080 RepID=A0A8H4RCU2_9HELO|nr:hypothetical protein G7Y89_g11917 [Cudoniella acicularis]